ncbi:MAG: BatA and WFA domain-containing protein [Candidatus Promineifilaceae bacterium]
MISFLTPAFLLLGLLAIPIILLYMLRLRRQKVIVSSTMLWQKLLRDREANAPWQKLRRNLLLILQLLILGALVLALARPFLPTPTVATGNLIVLLDASASMLATDTEPTRYDTAKTEIAQLINDLSSSSQMTLINVGHTPTILAAATSDKTTLRQALQSAQPDPTTANWAAALALASGAAQGYKDARIVIVSDGGLFGDLPPLPTEPQYIPIGRSSENLAITALATRELEGQVTLFASVRNEGQQDRETLITIYLDETIFDSRRITVPEQTAVNLTWSLPGTPTTIQAQLSENDGDFLPVDDVAWAVHEGGISNRILLVTEGNLFLEQLFTVLPGVTAFKAAPGSDLLAEPFDMYVFDSTPLPDPLPESDLLIINPQPANVPASSANTLLTVSGTFSNTTTTRLANSPLLQFVDWRTVNIQQAQRIDAPWAQPLVEAEGGPLLLIGEQNGRRVAVLTFDLHASDLPLQIAFPILMANITSWLSPGQAFENDGLLHSGDPVTLTPSASSTAVLVTKPDGTVWQQEVGEDALVFTETTQPGLYAVALRDAQGTRAAGQFAVNLFAPEESDIQPTSFIQIGQTTVETSENEDVGQYELWPWLLATAVIILIIEWWVHFQGARLPVIKRTKS